MKKNMSITAIVSGILLIILGAYGYFGMGKVSVTALIPLFLGVPILILGIVEFSTNYSKIIVIIEMVLMIAGFLGAAFRAFPKAFGGEFPAPVIIQLIMCAICLVFIYQASKSLI